MKKLVLSLLCVGMLFGLGCRPGTAPQKITADVSAAQAKHLTMEQVRRAIEVACVNRGWQYTEMRPGLIEGKLVVRNKHTVMVEIPYTANSYAINYKSSVNMEYNAATGHIHPNYNKWVNTLRTDIDKNLDYARIAK